MTQKALPEDDTPCHRCSPYLNEKLEMQPAQSCRERVQGPGEGCYLWAKIVGVNANTGETIDRWGCLDTVTHMLQIETNKRLDEMGAVQEQQRNMMNEMWERSQGEPLRSAESVTRLNYHAPTRENPQRILPVTNGEQQ